MLLKCFTQYARKFGKSSSGHRTGKGQVLFQLQRRAIPKNVQTTIQLCSFHVSKAMLNILLGRFQQYLNWKLPDDLEKAEEPEVKLSTSLDHGKSKRIPENIYFCFVDYAKASDYGSQQTVENSLRDGNTSPPHLSPEKPICRSRNSS